MINKLTLKGSPLEVGEQHGSLGKKQVQQSLTTYEELFYGYQGLSWNKAREAALVHIPAIEKYDSQLLEEMEGIAKGAGVEFEDILALNARTEIALGSYKKNVFSDGCTAFATMPPIGGDTIIAQNWDWKGSQIDSLLLLEIHIKGKPIITMVTEGGMIGKIGYNSSQLGLCFNALLTDKKSDEVPIHVALRGILNAETMTDAIARVKNGQTAASASIIVGKSESNGSGMAINMEVSPFGIDFVGGEDGYLVHSNHILSENLKRNLLDTNEYAQEDSAIRYMRGRQLIKSALAEGREINADLYAEWLSDDFNAPNAINHLCNPKAKAHRQSETVFSIIMNLSKQRTWLYIGKPKDGTYVEI